MQKENLLLTSEIDEFLSRFSNSEVVLKYRQRLNEGKLTKDENPESHFCAYFAAYDKEKKMLFLGHHKKSGLWLFNGGHIDAGEATVRQTVIREIDEEWGLNAGMFTIKEPDLLTITEINNPTKQKCRFHYDIWHFIPVDSEIFKPNQDKLAEEFHRTDWLSVEVAKNLVTDQCTLEGVDYLEKNYFAEKNIL